MKNCKHLKSHQSLVHLYLVISLRSVVQCPVTCPAGDLSAIHNHDFFTLVFCRNTSHSRELKNPASSTCTQDEVIIMAEIPLSNWPDSHGCPIFLVPILETNLMQMTVWFPIMLRSHEYHALKTRKLEHDITHIGIFEEIAIFQVPPDMSRG